MRSRIGEPFQSAIFAGLPPIAVPITVKMPDPITAPMPSAVSETGPNVFFKACSGLSDSEISLSIDFVAKICLASALAPAYRRIGAGRFNCSCASESERDCHHAGSGARNRIRQRSGISKLLPGRMLTACSGRGRPSGPWPCFRHERLCAGPWGPPSSVLRASLFCARPCR
jgi:hypothetical protein